MPISYSYKLNCDQVGLLRKISPIIDQQFLTKPGSGRMWDREKGPIPKEGWVPKDPKNPSADNRLWDYKSEFDWSERKAWSVLRSLYGILAVERGYRIYEGFYVPEHNMDPTREALENKGLFKKEIMPRDIPILKTLLKLDQEIRKRYGASYTPTFHEQQIARILGRGRTSTRNSLERLVGLIAAAHIDSGMRVPCRNTKGFFSVYRTKFFIPHVRVPNIVEVLAT